MGKIAIGKPVPDIEMQATDGQTFRLSELQGKNVVLYFYPKDNTPGCTTEGQDFRDQYEAFRKLKTEIFGVSRDSLKSHESFKAKQCFPFDLISDPDEELCQLFDVIKEKSLYGRRYLGIDRSTFIIDKKGILRKEFRGVKVAGHVATVLAEIKKLANGKD
jgi:peroxiredoxin Q/BCP